MSADPFTPTQKSLVLVVNGTEKKAGPFPGDDVLYTFKLYHDSDFRKHVGTALFTCYFAFAKKATCEGYFELGSNELVADGQITFDRSKFALAVAGGIGADLGARGQVLALASRIGLTRSASIFPSNPAVCLNEAIFPQDLQCRRSGSVPNNADDELAERSTIRSERRSTSSDRLSRGRATAPSRGMSQSTASRSTVTQRSRETMALRSIFATSTTTDALFATPISRSLETAVRRRVRPR